MLTRDQIQQHIDALDVHIPREDADLIIWHQGDSYCEFIGNYIGYLRFGIEMLRAVVVDGTVSIDYMEVQRWSLHVTQITRREDVRAFAPQQFPPLTWKSHVMACFEVFLGIFVCVCLLIGFWEVLVWVGFLEVVDGARRIWANR